MLCSTDSILSQHRLSCLLLIYALLEFVGIVEARDDGVSVEDASVECSNGLYGHLVRKKAGCKKERVRKAAVKKEAYAQGRDGVCEL